MKKPYVIFAVAILLMGGAILFQDVSTYGKIASFVLTSIGSFWIGRLVK